MKHIIKISIACLLLFYNMESLLAQGKQIKFSGIMKDPMHKKFYPRISVFYSSYDWFATKDSGHYIHTDIDSSGNFNFSIPDLNKPNKINLSIYEIYNGNNDDTKVAWQYILFVEPNDNINIDIIQTSNGNSLKFSGTGAEKYNLSIKLQEQYMSYVEECRFIMGWPPIIKSSKALEQKMDSLTFITAKYNAKKTDLLTKANISSKMRAIMNYESGSFDYNSDWTYRLRLLWDNFPEYRSQITSHFTRYDKQFTKTTDSLAKYCSFYIEGLVLRTIMDLLVKNQSSKIDLKELYNTVKNKYSGIVRDRAISYVLIDKKNIWACNPSSLTVMDSLLNDASQLVTLKYMKDVLIERKNTLERATNKKVIDAQFVGIDARKVSLESLRGKVVLIDSWFNGCFGCADFHEFFHKNVYPKFKQNKNFVVLSVNIDKEKPRWESGIASGKYASWDYLNVSTMNWLDHPFMKYYNVTGSPWMMLIDPQGNILWQPNGFSYEEMTSRISSALEKMNIQQSK